MLYSDHHFSDNFCAATVAECAENIKTLTSFNLVAMPGAGVTFFLRALEQKANYPFIFINSYELHEFSREDLFAQIGSKLGLETDQTPTLEELGRALANRAKDEERLVMVFNRLDRLGEVANQNFYDNLLYLRSAAPTKVVFLFVSSQPLLDVLAKNIKDILSLITKTTYFGGYSTTELTEISHSSGITDIETAAMDLAGGNHSLSQLLLRCQSIDNPLFDPLLEMFIKDVYYSLTAKQRKQLDAFILKNVEPQDEYLLGVGFVKDRAGKLQTFTPLLSEYVRLHAKQHLPTKEKRLMRLLLLHQGKVVSKAAIMDYVWPEHDGVASDWSLNALVYRLRRHSAFDAHLYTIESRKKEGYILYDHTAE